MNLLMTYVYNKQQKLSFKLNPFFTIIHKKKREKAPDHPKLKDVLLKPCQYTAPTTDKEHPLPLNLSVNSHHKSACCNLQDKLQNHRNKKNCPVLNKRTHDSRTHFSLTFYIHHVYDIT